MILKKISIQLLFLALSLSLFGQKEVYYRIRADFSIKEKSTDGKSNLTMGQVFYDKLKKKIVYNVRFPEKEVWLFADTNMYTVRGSDIKKKPLIPGYIDFSIFNLALNNNLKDYGLKKTMYSLKGVVKEGNMVISSWMPQKEYAKVLGEVKISVVNNKLNGVIIYNPKKVMIGKQLFSDYVTINGFDFPTEIINFSYLENGQEIHQITTYKNIKVNDWDEESFYSFSVPR
jgi:hypothetical protein